MYEELDELTYDSLIRWDKKKLVNFTLSLLEEQKKLKPSHFNDNRRHPHGLEYECTDTGNMHRFIDRNHEKARSTGSPKEWLTWDGRRWCYTQQTYVFE